MPYAAVRRSADDRFPVPSWQWWREQDLREGDTEVSDACVEPKTKALLRLGKEEGDVALFAAKMLFVTGDAQRETT